MQRQGLKQLTSTFKRNVVSKPRPGALADGLVGDTLKLKRFARLPLAELVGLVGAVSLETGEDRFDDIRHQDDEDSSHENEVESKKTERGVGGSANFLQR